MRLTSKIFVATSIPVLAVATVGALSLGAIDRLVSANRETVTRAIPTMRLSASAQEAVRRLGRLEARYGAVGDERYARAWEEETARLEVTLARLTSLATTPPERAPLETAAATVKRYREVMRREQALVARGQRAAALRLARTDGQAEIGVLEEALDELEAAAERAVAAAAAEAEQVERRTWRWVLGGLGGTVVLALVAGGVVALRLTRSMRQLSAATAAMARGSSEVPLDLAGRDEIAELARAFAAMRAEVETLDRLKEEFFAAISHDLRSPLTSVSEAAHLLREQGVGPLTPKQARLVAVIQASTERLLRLVARILDVSGLRAGVVPLDQSRVDLAALSERVLDEFTPRAREAGVALAMERTGQSFTVVGDEDRLIQVLVNLVDNALRFTPSPGRITVRLVESPVEVRVHVEDTGVGIPRALLPTVFEPYRQARRDRGGTGLGLAIVQSVVRAHGGGVAVDSQEGKGSRFTVMLPRARSAA
jgi:signal transduction histidine kinase